MKFIIALHFLLISVLAHATLPQVNFSTGLKNVMEGDMVTVTAELSQTTSDLVMVPFHVTGSADSNDSNLTDGVIYISPNQSKGSITFQVFHDDENEQTDTIILSMLAPTNAILGTTRTQTINIHNSDLPTLQAKISFLTTEQTAHEGEVVSVTITLDQAADGFIYAPYEVSGNASFGTDHNFKSGTILFFPGQKTAIFNVDLFVDQETEQAEDIIINLKSPLGNVTFGNITTHIIHIPAEATTNLQPIADFTINPITGEAPLATTINAAASNDPDGGAIAEYQWNFGNNETLSTTIPVINHTFTQTGEFTVSLVVKDDEGTLSLPKTFSVIVTAPIQLGSVSGITFKDNVGPIGNVDLELKFTTTNEIFHVTADASGKYFFSNLPTSGNFTITSLTNDNFSTKGIGNITQTNPSQELALIFKLTGIGKFSGTAVMNNDQSVVVPNTSMVIRSFDNSYEASTVTDYEGKFSFENLPLLGRYYIAIFHEDGRFRNSSFVITPAQPEVTNINYLIFTLPGFPFLTNSAFSSGGFESWFGLGNLTLAPQSEVFGPYLKTRTFSNSSINSRNPRPLPYHYGQEWYEEDAKLPPRTHLKTESIASKLNINKKLPCENRNYAGVATTAQPTDGVGQGILEQFITMEDDADTLVGRVRFLTNETIEDAQLGYNDTFTVLFSNPSKSVFLKQGDVKNLTWGAGILGFQYATQEFDIALDVRSLRGKKAKLSFLVFDRGDSFGVSGIALSNFQIVKSSERNFVESGSWNGDTIYSNNLGEVSWFTVTNPSGMSVLKITNPLILAKNKTVTIPTVKFGSEPIARNFTIDALSSSDIFNYTLESTWISSMPTSLCSGEKN